jgi:hypothetical protein
MVKPRCGTANVEFTGFISPPHEFNTIFRDWLVDNMWQQCISDPCIYIFRIGTILAVIALYVDDISAACNDPDWLTSAKTRQLGAKLKIKELGAISQLLGMHTTRDMFARAISLDQSKCLRDILASKHGIPARKSSPMPMDPCFLSGLARMHSPPLTGAANKDVWAACNSQPCARAMMCLRLWASLAPLKRTPRRLTSRQ